MRNLKRKVGVIIVNLGTPDAPEAGALRRYLREFLGDPRVVEAPRWLWWLALNLVILRIRPAKSARNYRKIWTAQGSPLMHYTCALTEKIAARLNADYGERVVVKAAMRYGNPHFTEALSALHQQGVERLLVLPLFPQYSGSTTGSIYDCLGAQLRHWRYIPHVHVIGDYYVDDEYIAALAHSVKQRWERQGMRPSKLLFSFHGIPQRYVDKGDPYAKQCLATAEAVASALGLASDQWCTAFQSRFGREQWLKPYTSEVLTAWAKQGVESVSVICPGFAVDCLETIEEIGEENAHLFLSNGGKTFDYIPALNDDLTHVSALTNLVSRSINEW